MSSCKYADVIVDIVHEKLDKPFTYRIPEELADRAVPGTPVNIPFGTSKRLKKGYIIALKDEPGTGIDPSRIKSVDSIAAGNVSLEDEFISLAAWMKDRYGCTMSKALKTVLPVKKESRARAGRKDPVSDNRHEYKLHDPNAEQKDAIDRFTEVFDAGTQGIFLLFGITGSGKTDTYLHMMEHVIRAGRKVILLIPEISLTYQTIDRLYAAFGDRIAVIHSRLSPGERYEQISRCRSGAADIIIGPRSALFAPFKDIGLIVIDEEHDGAYKNENIPRYNTVDVAKKRAQMHNACIVLASATPSPESYMNALKGDYTLLRLTSRPGGAKRPDIEVIDMRDELRKGNRSIFSDRLAGLIRERLDRKEQVILFMNRRGYSNFVSCRSCGNAIKCPHCDVSMTLHAGHRLVCHYCGYRIDQPDRCPDCGSPYIAEFGVGTQKLEKMTKGAFPDARVARLDTDATAGKQASEDILRDFAEHRTDILIGTQMVVKGHDYHNVTLVGIMAADTSIYASRYDSGERTFELIAQAAGRAGRGDKPGTVVIQTYKPEHYAIANASADCFDGYYEREMAYRKLLNYPPVTHIWTAQIASTDPVFLSEVSECYSQIIRGIAEQYNAEFIGPVDPAVSKVKDYYRKLIYLKHADHELLLKVKEEADSQLKLRYPDILISIMHDFT